RNGTSKRTLPVHRFILLAGHGEEGGPFRVRVHDSLHFGPHAVDAAMEVALERCLVSSFNLIRFDVYCANIVHGKPAALARADVDKDLAVIEPDTAMSVVVDDIRLLEHSDAIDQLLLHFH